MPSLPLGGTWCPNVRTAVGRGSYFCFPQASCLWQGLAVVPGVIPGSDDCPCRWEAIVCLERARAHSVGAALIRQLCGVPRKK
jgi:hypothetical protein